MKSPYWYFRLAFLTICFLSHTFKVYATQMFKWSSSDADTSTATVISVSSHLHRKAACVGYRCLFWQYDNISMRAANDGNENDKA